MFRTRRVAYTPNTDVRTHLIERYDYNNNPDPHPAQT
jgi:hypothetical protein